MRKYAVVLAGCNEITKILVLVYMNVLLNIDVSNSGTGL